MYLWVAGYVEAALFKQSIESAGQIAIAGCRLSIAIFPQTSGLIAFRGRMHMEIVKTITLDTIGVLVASTVVPSHAEGDIRPCGSMQENNRKVERIYEALTDAYLE